MLAQINVWKSLTSASTVDVGLAGKTTRDTLTVSEAMNPDNANNSGIVTLMAESASLKAPMIVGSETAASYVYIPATSGIKDLTSVDAGTATLSFSVLTSDFYKVFMYVNAPDVSADSLYAKISGSDYKEWTMNLTTGFQWMELTNTPQKLQTEFYLTGSKTYQLEIRQKDPGMKVAKVIVTNDLNYDPNAMVKVNQKATLSASLSELTGVSGSYIDIDIEEYDLYSYKLTNPRVRTTKDLRIKKLKVLVNGSFNPQHSTYLVVDKVVGNTDPVLSTYSMVLLKDKGPEIDKLSFSFDVIEAVK